MPYQMIPNSQIREHVYCVESLKELQSIEDRHLGRPKLLRLWTAQLLCSIANGFLKALIWILFGPPYRPNKDPKSIAVYTVWTLGDNLVMLPSIAALKKRYPSAKITAIVNCWCTNFYFAEQLQGRATYVNEVVPLARDPVEWRNNSLAFNLPNNLPYDCDLFVNLSPFGNIGRVGTVLRELMFAKKLRAKRVMGFQMNFLTLGDRLQDTRRYFVKNEPRRGASIIWKIGIEPVAPDVSFPPDPESQSFVKHLLNSCWQFGEPLIVLNPGAKLQFKCWPVERFKELGVKLLDQWGGCAAVVGLDSEKDLANAVCPAGDDRFINLAGRTDIRQLAELLRMATICITNDTGTLHLAAMVGAPTVGLFATKISPTQWFPFGSSVKVLLSYGASRAGQLDDEHTDESLLMIPVHAVLSVVESFIKTNI